MGFDCNNTWEAAFTRTYTNSNAPWTYWVQSPTALPPGNTNPYPHIGPADYSK